MSVWNPLTKKWEEESDYTKSFSNKLIQDNTPKQEKEIKVKYSNKPLSNLSTAPLGNILKNTVKTPENFKDGYQVGDVTKTVGSTALDLGTKTVKGIMGFGENIGDLAQYGVAQVSDWLGADNFANTLRENAKFNSVDYIFAPAEGMYGKNSVAGKTSTDLAQGVGNILAMANGGALLPKGAQSINVGKFSLPTTSIVSGLGGGMTEAYENGATNAEAWGYGALSGLTESFSESLFSGLGGKFTKVFGEGALDDAIIKKVTNKISNRTLKILAESGLKASGEGIEEVISGYGNAIAKKLTYLSDEEFSKIVSDENLLDQLIQGTLLSLVMQAPSTVQSVSQGRDYITGMNTVDEAVNARNNLYKDINSNITENSNTNVANSIKNNNNVLAPLAVNNVNTGIKNSLNIDTNNAYQYEVSDNQKINAFNESIKNSGLINSETTKSFADICTKVIQDRDVNILVDSTLENNVNGLYDANTNTIKINPNSERATEFILTHELTHSIATDEMIRLANDYASKNLDFKTSVESLLNQYNKTEIDEEVLADISGQLFGNQEFINNLSMQEPSLFKKIYNKIIEWANKLTGNTHEALFIRDLKNKWETAYRNQGNRSGSEIKYSTIGLKGAKNLASNSDSRYYKNLLNNQKNAVEIFNNSNENLENTNIKSKQETGWFQTKYGDWSTLISDKNSKLLQKLEPNKTYKLGNILEHDLLYKAYPELQKLRIKTADIDSTGGYATFSLLPANTATDEIYIRNSDLNKKDFRKTLLHEINHYIEHKEKYDKRSRGADSKTIGMENYRNNLGEIISNETKMNADLTQEQLDAIILPEQAKEKPQYKNIREKLLESNRNDLLKNGDGKNALQNLGLPIQNKIQNNKVVNKKNNKSSRIINDIEELDNSSFSFKQKQLDIILENNPAEDDFHTWIRTIDDVKTFDETLQDNDWADYVEEGFNPDYTGNMVKEALETGKITVYSSYPIEQGIFVSPSRMEAESYSGDGKIYSKEVNIDDIAWIDPTQGQYAKVQEQIEKNNSQVDNQGRTLTKEQQEFFKYSKERAEDGSLNTMYHGTKNGGFTTFDRSKAKSSGNFGTGFYFAPTKSYSNDYVDNSSNSKMYEVYLNIINPVDAINKNRTLSNEQVRTLVEAVAKNEDYGIENYGYNATIDNVTNDLIQHRNDFEIFQDLDITCVGDFAKLVELSNEVLGTTFDGIRTPLETIVFNPNQIKNIDNTNPTSDADIRYSQENKTWKEHLEENYKSTGTKTYFKDMMPYATKESFVENIQTNKIQNPNEISKLKPIDANATPIAPTIKVDTGTGKSKFFDNILDKTDMLTWDSKKTILSDDDVKYYQEVTNKESLEKAFDRLNKGGKSETFNWLSKPSENATSVDIAEGWILLKQYQDNIEKTTDIALKDELNRSMVQVAKKMRDMGTKAGQTVQAFNIMNRLTPEGMVYYAQTELSEAYDNMVKNKTKDWIDNHKADFELSPSETQFIMDTMQKVSQMKDGYDKKVELAKIQKLMTDKLPPERGAGIKAWMRISMLFNPKTQVRNVVGNAVIAPVNSVNDLVASGIDKLISSKTGVRTTGKTDLKSYSKGFKKGLSQSYNDFRLGINTRNIEGNRFEIGKGKSFNDKTKIGKSLNSVDNLLSFMLDVGDRGFYEASFNNSINNQMILNNTTEVTQDMIDIATSEALSRTWQDNNCYTQFVLNIRKGLNKINFRGYGLGDTLIPFAKTPANLTKAIVDYSPVGMINAITSGINLKRSLSNGQFTPQMQHKFVQNLGKATAGTMLYVLGYALAKAGVTSGESDEDKDVANFMKNTLGISSYSIKIGNKSFTYDWAQPIAAPLSIMANFNEKQKDNPDASTLENLVNSLDVAGNILLEQSFMESINTVFSNTDGPATGIQEAIMELPSRAFPTLMKQIVDLTDSTQRQSFVYDKPLETMANKVKAKIPGLSQALAPTVDTMGREIQKYGGKNNIFNVFFNPANVNTENISESAEEIYRLYKATGDTTVMPRVSPYYINSKGEKVILTNQQKSEFQKISGNIIEDSVKDLLKDSKYKNLSNEDKANVVNEIVNYSYNKARYEVLGMEMSNTYNKVNEYTNKGGQVYDYYLNKEEINYSLNNPEKYNVISSFNFKYDDYSSYQTEINDIKNQYSTTTERKQAVFNYINNLQYNKYQKIILFKLLGGYGIKDYQNEIFNYINSLKLTKNEKQTLWNYLYS